MSKDYEKPDLWKNKPQVNSFDKECSKKLESTIRIKRKVFAKINRVKWMAHFQKLRVVSRIKKSRIKKVLAWYLEHFGEEFVPKAYSAKGFCEKFLKIEDAMNRDLKDAVEGKNIRYKVTRRK